MSKANEKRFGGFTPAPENFVEKMQMFFEGVPRLVRKHKLTDEDVLNNMHNFAEAPAPMYSTPANN